MTRDSLHCNVFMGVHKIGEGTTIFVIVEDRPAFDLIQLPEGGNEKVRTKSIEAGNQQVIFQFWIEEP